MQEATNFRIKSPLGDLKLNFKNNLLASVQFIDSSPIDINEKTVYARHATDQLMKYLSGSIKQINIPFTLEGTTFQKIVWQNLLNIPYGKTISYSKLAKDMGDEKKVRAVANAIARNPLPIVIPCHRVVGKNGTLTGYLGGIDRKGYLLNLENESQLTLF